MTEGSSNPFLIRPGTTPPPAEPTSAPVPVESGTRRVPVTPPPAAAPVPAPRVVPSEGAPAPAEAPSAAPPTGPAATVGPWTLRTAEGAEVALDGAVVIGRNPSPPPEWPDAVRLPVDDPGKTVSKTHAVLALREGAVIVRDLSSTNGTAVSDATGERTLAPGTDYEVTGLAAELRLGGYAVEVRR